MHQANKQRILLADDEYPILFTLKSILEKAGYSIRTCLYGWEALAAVSQEHFDLALLDYMMPDLRGDELAIKLRQSHPNLPIIFLSGFQLPEEVQKLASAFLTKPQPPAMLLDVVRQALSAKFLPIPVNISLGNSQFTIWQYDVRVR